MAFSANMFNLSETPPSLEVPKAAVITNGKFCIQRAGQLGISIADGWCIIHQGQKSGLMLQVAVTAMCQFGQHFVHFFCLYVGWEMLPSVDWD